MTPKEKLKQLVDKFKGEQPIYTEDTDEENEKRAMYFAKRCALIALDLAMEFANESDFMKGDWDTTRQQYLQQVKKEIEKS